MTSIRVMLQSKIDACYLHQSARSLVMEIEDHLASSMLDTPSAQEYFSALAAKHNDCQRNALSFENETSLIVTMQQLRDKFRDAQKCSREASRMSIPTSVVPASAEVKLSSDYSRSSRLRVDLPTFNGKSTAWYSFWTLFSAIIKEQKISSTEKTCHLIQAMESEEAKTLATQAAGDEMNFDHVVDILCERYERKRVLFAQYLQSMVTKCKTGYNHHDFSALSSQIKADHRGLELCSAYTADQIQAGLIESTFDDDVKAKWMTYTEDTKDPPTMELVLSFLEKQLILLPEGPVKKQRKEDVDSKSITDKFLHNRRSYGARDMSNIKCPACRKEHKLFKCPTFRDWDHQQRQRCVKSNHLCFNCLTTGHSVSKCLSDRTCKECNERHHTMLYPPKETSAVVTASSSIVNPQRKNFLRTALSKACSGQRSQSARILLDPGSEASMITQRMANKLHAKKIPCNIVIQGVGKSDTRSTHYVDIFLGSLHEPSDDEVKVTCYVVDNILPVSACQDIQALRNKPEIQVLSPLADPQLGEAGNVDILLSITDGGRCYRNVYYQIDNQTINIHRTIFGWTVGGASPSPGTSAVVGRVSCRELTTNELLASFFELEKVPGEDTHQSPDEVAALQHFTDNHNRDSSGRYTVALPRKTPHLELGSSRPAALRRFRANERKLKATEGHWEEFCRGLDEYIEMDHAELVPKEDLEKPDKDCYYLPMHGVQKESSSTTRLRIVFDASAKTSSGHSLNDQLLTGPSLYPKLTSVITQFRQHRIAASADISKMFTEILLHPNERDFHRFLRYSPSSHQIETCRMKRLTFGVSSSPFLATKVLRQAAADHKEEFPEAAEVIINSFYVDDCLTGAATLEESKELQVELNQLLSKAGMTLRKWRTNCSDFLESIPEHLCEKSLHPLSLGLVTKSPETYGKALGVHWDSLNDVFFVAVPDLRDLSHPTKRQVTSAISRVYDVLGWFSPAILRGKILLQRLWTTQTEWDDEIPAKLLPIWQSWQNQIPLLASHPVQRRYSQSDSPVLESQLHAFSDASSQGYGGVVYLRLRHADTSISVSLVTSKTKVAPIKQLTIPILELSAVLLTARLLNTVAKDLQIPTPHLYAWTDSTIVLGWLNNSAGNWKIFVSNRISQVLSVISSSQWRHVPSLENPADHASRGLLPSDLLQSKLWWEGPPWLKLSASFWPPPVIARMQSSLPEVRANSAVCHESIEEDHFLWKKFSSFKVLLQIAAWCRRFVC